MRPVLVNTILRRGLHLVGLGWCCQVFQPPGPFVLGPHPEFFAGFHSQLFEIPVWLQALHASCPEPEHMVHVDSDSVSGSRDVNPSPPTCKYVCL